MGTTNFYFSIALFLFAIYGIYKKPEYWQILIYQSTLFLQCYLVGYSLAKGDPLKIIMAFLALIALIIVLWPEYKKGLENQNLGPRKYSRKELIIAKKIYDSNYLADPVGFSNPNGTYEDAEVSINYLLGIIDADGKPYKKVKYESRKYPS
ncbi:hypothetical protein [Zunongwangia profunda]|uniref:hypothetical protein n=1 Tax=Zunongwangia profunda TaxID=398743 RepID=UPI001D185D48|nr:hypothetical protein [Zunongwangia profunda]MCC4228407.1 hypothetical protein [Zunongwangia profunda]